MTVFAYALLALVLGAWWIVDRLERRQSAEVSHALRAPCVRLVRELADWEREGWA